MKITETLIMRGPNQWSDSHPHLIVFKVQTEEDPLLNEYFIHHLRTTFPGKELELVVGQRIEDALLFIIRELLFSAGLNMEYGTVQDTREENLKRIIFSFEIEVAGTYAANSAVNIANAVLKKEEYDLCEYLKELKYIKRKHDIGPTTSFILNEVKSRNFPYRQFEGGSLVTIGYGIKQKKMRTAVADSTSGLGIEIAGDKTETKAILAEANLPVPQGLVIHDEEELEDAVKTMRFPLVTKPLDGNHGRGVTTNINNLNKARYGFHLAKQISDAVIVEEFVEGEDYRFLVIDYKLVAVAKRTPAKVTGDGISTIQQLIDLENMHPERGDTADHVLALIKVDNVTMKILSDQELTLDSVLPNGKTIFLKDIANISAGGTSTDMTDQVHPDNVYLAERVARIFRLDICGIDILTKDITLPLSRDTGAIIEVNAGPGIRMHTNPTEGIARNVAKPIVDMVFPDGDALIPIVAVTGTNGKTTTTRLIAHLAREAGFKPGYTTTDGIYLQGHLIQSGDCTGPRSAQAVLFDPTIDFAVLECARGGIIRSGLGFEKCNVSVVTNITEDHLGLKDVYTVEEMAKVKSVVPKSTFREGYAVLNADDDLVYNMQADLYCQIALFSMDEKNERVVTHYQNGGLAAVVEKGYITVYNGSWKTRIEKLVNIPLTFEGRAESMIKNILAAVLAATAQKFDVETIRRGLTTFIPSPELTPGRMNIFKFSDFEVMIDYAHNPDGFTLLRNFMTKTRATSKTGIIAATGDRKDEDIRTIGKLAAEMLDEIVIRHDRDLRGRPIEEHTRLLLEGIRSAKPDIPVTVITEEKEAILHCIRKAEAGSLILVCADHVPDTIQIVKDIHDDITNTLNTNDYVAYGSKR